MIDGVKVPGVGNVEARILIVDDDEVFTRLVAIWLVREKYDVSWARNGKVGVEMCEHGIYDLVWMDVQMPVMNGLEAVSTISKRSRTIGERTPVIAVTAFALKSDLDMCLSAGFDELIAKPVNLRECLEIIHRYTDV